MYVIVELGKRQSDGEGEGKGKGELGILQSEGQWIIDHVYMNNKTESFVGKIQ